MKSFTVRIPDEIKTALDNAAHEDRRPVANLVAMVLERWLEAEGYLQPDPKEKPAGVIVPGGAVKRMGGRF